jgi:phage shock protein A
MPSVDDDKLSLAQRHKIARSASSWTSLHPQEYVKLLEQYVDELERELQDTNNQLLDAKETNKRYWERIKRDEGVDNG